MGEEDKEKFICGLPRRTKNLWFAIGRLWETSKIVPDLKCKYGVYSTKIKATLSNGQVIILPNSFDINGEESQLTAYVQQVLELNGHDDMIIYKDWADGFIKIITRQELQAVTDNA